MTSCTWGMLWSCQRRHFDQHAPVCYCHYYLRSTARTSKCTHRKKYGNRLLNGCFGVGTRDRLLDSDVQARRDVLEHLCVRACVPDRAISRRAQAGGNPDSCIPLNLPPLVICCFRLSRCNADGPQGPQTRRAGTCCTPASRRGACGMSIVEIAAPVPGTYADIAHAVWTVTRAATTTIGLSRWQYMAQACLQVARDSMRPFGKVDSWRVCRAGVGAVSPGQRREIVGCAHVVMRAAAGAAEEGAGIVSGLRRPAFACVDQDGNVYVTETGEPGVLVLAQHKAGVQEQAPARRRIGDRPKGAATSDFVYARIEGGKGIAVVDDRTRDGERQRRLYVADSVANKVVVMDAESGALLSVIGGYGSKPGKLHHPVGLCITWRQTVLVSERLNRRVQEFTSAGELLRVIAVPGPTPTPSDGYLWGDPRGVTSCSRGCVYIVDVAQRTRKGRVLVYDTEGKLVLSVGPSISGQCPDLGVVQGEIVDAMDVAMLNADSLLLSHCFQPAAGCCQSVADAGRSPHVVSEFEASSGKWMRFHSLVRGDAPPVTRVRVLRVHVGAGGMQRSVYGDEE